MSHQPNPITQGISLAKTVEALQTLASAVTTVDQFKKDTSLDQIRATLGEQLARYEAELNALINLHGGPDAH